MSPSSTTCPGFFFAIGVMENKDVDREGGSWQRRADATRGKRRYHSSSQPQKGAGSQGINRELPETGREVCRKLILHLTSPWCSCFRPSRLLQLSTHEPRASSPHPLRRAVPGRKRRGRHQPRPHSPDCRRNGAPGRNGTTEVLSRHPGAVLLGTAYRRSRPWLLRRCNLGFRLQWRRRRIWLRNHRGPACRNAL